MAVVAFVRPEPGVVVAPTLTAGYAGPGRAEGRLRLYARAMRLCFLVVLASWVVLEIGCLLSLFLHFQSGIVVGTIDGSLAFKFWPSVDYFSPDHAMSDAFVPHVFPMRATAVYAIISIVASIPFCASLFYFAQLFDLYSRGQVFGRRNAIVTRRIGHSAMATGYSPLLLGPVAHLIGVLKPVTGVTDGMIAFVFLGLILLAISHVMEIGQRMRQDQEEIL